MASRSMKTTPAMACLKTLLTIFSIIFLIIGIAFLVAGVWVKVRFMTFAKLSTIDYTTAPWVMIAIGCFIIIVGFMGCCATIKGNTCLLRTYGLFLALIFVCELAGAISATIFRKKVDDGFKDGMQIALTKYNETDYKKAFDDAQSTLHCCGVDNYAEWWQNASFPEYNVPKSCCKNETLCKPLENGNNLNLTSVASDPSKVIYTKGCHTLISDGVNSNLGIIIGTMFGVAFFQVIGLILACCLASSINSNKYELV